MSRKRKTIEVDVLRKEVNRLLALEDFDDTGKEALGHFLEGILFDTGNYNGFQYIEKDMLDRFDRGNRQYF